MYLRVQGVAVAGEALAMASTVVVGTYGYMAPEQFRGAAQPASDLYSLGATLLFLLSGGYSFLLFLFSFLCRHQGPGLGSTSTP